MRVLGEVNGKELVIVREQRNNVTDNDIFFYYLGDEKIGVYDPKVMDDKIMFLKRTKEDEQLEIISDNQKEEIKGIIDAVGKDFIKSTPRDYTTSEVEKIENSLQEQGNLKPAEKIKSICVLKDPEKKDEPDLEEEENEQQRLSAKDFNVKQQMDANQIATDFKTVGKLFEDAGKEPETENDETIASYAIVNSDEMKKFRDENGDPIERNTTKYSIIAITSKGRALPVDAKQDRIEGSSPTKDSYQVSYNGEVEEGHVVSRLDLGQDRTISIKIGQNGKMEVYYSKGKTHNGAESLDIQIPTDEVYPSRKEVRDLASEYNGVNSVNEGTKEGDARKLAEGEDKVQVADLDGNPKTVGENINDDGLYTEDKEFFSWEELAARWGIFIEGREPDIQRVKDEYVEWRKDHINEPVDNFLEDKDYEYQDPREMNGRPRG